MTLLDTWPVPHRAKGFSGGRDFCRVVEPGGIDFSRWYTDERDRLVRSLLVIGGDPEGARDAVAEAFSRAYERWGRVSAMASPTGWVYRVALNELRRRERRRRIESRLLGRKAPSPHLAPPEVDPELWLAVAALPAREREVIVLRYVADLREREVAAALGISEGAASAALVAARRRLARALEDKDEKEATAP
jgi:RNA polymerase sigma-70 factor (ECF subfamily)